MKKIRLLLALFVPLVPVVAQAQDVPDLDKLADIIRWGGVALSILVVIVALVVLRMVRDVADRLERSFAERRPTIQKFESVARFFIYLVAAGICVGLSIRLDSTALTVIGGALAFAVGFAMRDLVAALIAGIIIMFDRPFQVGDRVEYAGQYGDIIKIGLRSVRMNTLDHNIVTIPNNKILTDVTASGNYGALEMQVPMEFHIGMDQNAKLASELIREACLTSPYIFLSQPVPVMAKQVILENYVAVQLKARPYVFDCKYEKSFETDVHLRVLDAFRTHGILPPAILHRSMHRIDDDSTATVSYLRSLASNPQGKNVGGPSEIVSE
ncbi:MAG: mechanosensitive ion channel [Syntrophotaleaceae bacterium]